MRRLNCKRSIPNKFDRKFKDNFFQAFDFSTQSYDLQKLCAPIRDQGQEGDCVGNAIASACEFLQLQGIRADIPITSDPEEFIQGQFVKASSQFPYWGAREIEGTTDSDSGCNPQDAATFIEKYGICSDKLWPNNPSLVLKRPSIEAYVEAKTHKLPMYYVMDQDSQEMLTCLAQGFPFLVGIGVYSQFDAQWSNNNGNILMPVSTDQYEGGHCILIIGADANNNWKFQNSWGLTGYQGFGTLPWDYLLDSELSFDFITLRLNPATI